MVSVNISCRRVAVVSILKCKGDRVIISKLETVWIFLNSDQISAERLEESTACFDVFPRGSSANHSSWDYVLNGTRTVRVLLLITYYYYWLVLDFAHGRCSVSK